MPNTIEEAFEVFHTLLTQYSAEPESVKKHRDFIKSNLENNFGIVDFVRTGSTGNETGIKGHSDTDYFAVLPPNNLYSNSATLLSEIQSLLKLQYPKIGICIDCPAIIFSFGSGVESSTEIVPAKYLETLKGYDVYQIPDRNGDWIKASPFAHNTYVNRINKNSGNKLKPLIRFIKAWKYYNNVPISSFFIEIWVTNYVANKKNIIYANDIKNILNFFFESKLSAILDPTGISGYIYACSTDNKKADTILKIKSTLDNAEKAIASEYNGMISDAFHWWNMIYNNNFPKYTN